MALIAHVHENAVRRGLRVSCSVVDAQGHEIATARMDGATWFTAALARVKAQTAAAFTRDTEVLEALNQRFPGLLEQIGRQLSFVPTTLPGGVVHSGGLSVGVSGAQPEEDAALARDALAHVLGG
jgi:uncharacterized protein GlcG (DUF336 family)